MEMNYLLTFGSAQYQWPASCSLKCTEVVLSNGSPPRRFVTAPQALHQNDPSDSIFEALLIFYLHRTDDNPPPDLAYIA